MEENARLFVAAAQVLAVDFGIDVSVDEEKIRPSVIVDVEEHRSPPQVLGVEAQSSGCRSIGKRSVATVFVQR